MNITKSKLILFISFSFLLVIFITLLFFYVSKKESEQLTTTSSDATPTGVNDLALNADSKLNEKSKVLKVGFSFAKHPYVTPVQFADIDPYSSNPQQLGFEVDIFHAAITRAGYQYKPSFQPFSRIISDLTNGNLDAAETSGSPQSGIFYSRAIINCQNYAITKKSANLKINSLEDLKTLRMVGWQGASTDLGPSFTSITKNNPNYFENVNQEAQYKMFADGKVDAIVIDQFIFQWWDAQHAKKTGKEEKVIYHPIFPGVNPYYMGFRDKLVRDAFDKELIKMQESGEINRIITQYIKGNSSLTYESNQPVKVIFGIARPPYVMDIEGRGISIDLISEAFRRMRLIYIPSYASIDRMEKELSTGFASVAVEVRKFSKDFHYSEAFTTYHNGIATRSTEKLVIKNWSDLKKLRVAAWNAAQKSLGKSFSDAIPTFSKYTEFTNQREQVFQWANGNYDVILIDKNLLYWNLSSLSKEYPDQKILKVEEIKFIPFPVNPNLDWYVGFKSESLRNQFNRTLKEIRQDGTYERIIARYLPEVTIKNNQ